jgi:hypothetical protein
MMIMPYLQDEKAEERATTPQVEDEMPVAKRVAATAARPKRAAAAAAQRAIAATAVKRPRGRQMSGASIASMPGMKHKFSSHTMIRLQAIMYQQYTQFHAPQLQAALLSQGRHDHLTVT